MGLRCVSCFPTSHDRYTDHNNDSSDTYYSVTTAVVIKLLQTYPKITFSSLFKGKAINHSTPRKTTP